MRVPTGPGKIDDKTSAAPWRFGLLYNFDIDDATVKTEHQNWLRAIAAPAARGSSRVDVLLKGTASRSGSKLYNEALSQKRVEAVQKYLIGQGVPGNRIKLTWVGELEAELAGQKDGSENERDRAVGVLVRRQLAAAPRFERVIPGDDEDGFEPLTSPPWLMVPAADGERTLRLRNAGGFTLRSSAPNVLTVVDPATNVAAGEVVVPDDNELLTFRGGTPGQATVFGRDVDGREVPLLSVDVLPKRTASVAFYYVTDNQGRTTTRSVGDEDALLLESNRLFNRQANVYYTKRIAKPLPVADDLGDPVSPVTLGGSDLPKLRTLGDTSARIRVFFVWEYQSAPDRDTDARVDDIGSVVVVFEDDAGVDVGLCMAHEFGHNLGLEHRKKSRRLLMWPVTDDRAGRLERDQILIVNTNLAPK
jgi:hypothetical protein